MPVGLDVLRESGFEAVRDKRVGLVTHPAAIDEHFTTAWELLAAANHCDIAAVFGPEHGLTGEAQDLIPVAANGKNRVYSLYGDTFASLTPTPDMLRGLDVLVIDLVDVGSRYYTFQATMLYCLRACGAAGLPVLIFDRPNPLGRTVEGPTVQPGFESFVGPHPICTRHGMTMGELAGLYAAECHLTTDITVIRHTEPGPGKWVVSPSPNMPTRDTAHVYPGMCLVEGTTLSEGRGTTRPFELVGHPGLAPRRLARYLNAAERPGVRFLPATFRPTFQKHAGKSCGGVQLVVTDAAAFRPVATGLFVLMATHFDLREQFQWRTERYEFVDHIPAIDLLFGSDRERTMIDAGASFAEITEPWAAAEEAFRRRRQPYLLYP